MDKELSEIKQKVKRELADFLGVDPSDIEDESDLKIDLHMGPSELSDFTQILIKTGFNGADGLDLTEIETFMDLVETLNDNN